MTITTGAEGDVGILVDGGPAHCVFDCCIVLLLYGFIWFGGLHSIECGWMASGPYYVGFAVICQRKARDAVNGVGVGGESVVEGGAGNE